jgi:hypothetical protein
MIKHRAFIFVLISLLVSAFIVSSAVAQRGIIPVPIKDTAGNQVGLYKGSYALLIGVSDYTEGWPDLPEVKEDLIAVGDALGQIGFQVYKSLNPKRTELEGAINGFISKHGYEKDSRLLIYFAGHGHTILPKYGGTEMGYIVPSDAPNPNLDEQGFLKVGLSMQNIEVYARNIQSKHALFVFDSCFSGSIFSLSRAIPQIIQEKTNKPVRQFITAGRANQTVPDESIFRRQFIKALKGEGDYNKDFYVTASELGQYLEDTVTNYSKGSQTPQYGKLRDPTLDQGDFVFPISASVQMEAVKGQIQSEQDMIKQARIEEQNKQQQALDELKKVREDFAKELELLKQDREKTKRLQEELIQSRKMQEELNQQIRRSQENRTSSMGTRAPPMPNGKTINKWAEINFIEYLTYTGSLYDKPSTKKRISSLDNGDRVYVMLKQGSWYYVEIESGKKGWVTKVSFKYF